MALSSLTGKIATLFQATPTVNLTGGVYQPISTQLTINKQQVFTSTTANAVAGGADQVFSFQQAITAGSSATVDLTAMTNLLNQTAQAIVRAKSWQMRLLSAADDSTITPAPNAASTITVTNNGPATPCALPNFICSGSGLTVTLTVGATIVTAVAISAAGSGYPKSATFICSPRQAGGSGCLFMVTTNSSGVPTAVTFITGGGGTGYTAATVPTTPVGQFQLTTGNAMCLVDATAAGALVASTSNNLKIYNNDASNAVTFELDLFGGSS